MPAASGARSIDINCEVMRRLTNVISPEILGRRDRLGQQAERKAREVLAALAVAQPVGDERAEIDLAQFCFDRRCLEEMHLDEFAELVGDAVLVALDDRGVRDRQPQRPAKQGHHRIPVGETADGGGLGKGRDETERRMQRQHAFAAMKIANVAASTSVASSFDAAQFGGPLRVGRRVYDECAASIHDGFRRMRQRSTTCRHCERRGAIHASAERRLDCFVACAPRR